MPGARDVEGTEALVGESRRRTGGRVMRLMTSDSYPAYEAAILDAYGEEVTPPRTGRPGRPKGAYKVPPAGLAYATVEKVRKKGRVVEILTRVVFGTMAAVAAALAGSRVSRSINTSFLERQNADGPAPQREEVAEDVPILEGLAIPRGGHLLHDVQLQLLLAGEDAARADRRGALAETDPGDGRRTDRSRLVDVRMDQLARPCYGVRTRPEYSVSWYSVEDRVGMPSQVWPRKT